MGAAAHSRAWVVRMAVNGAATDARSLDVCRARSDLCELILLLRERKRHALPLCSIRTRLRTCCSVQRTI